MAPASGTASGTASDTSWDPPPAAPVPAALRPFVASMVGYAEVGVPRVHRGLPGPTLTMVLPLDEPLATAATEAAWIRGRLDRQWLVLGGLHTRAAYVAHPGRWRGIQVDLEPLGARRLLGLPAAALPADRWDARDLLGDTQDRLVELLRTAVGWRDRYDLVAAFLQGLLASNGEEVVRPEVARAWWLLEQSAGALRVGDLAAEVGYSRRRLTTLFTAELGVSPTTAGRLVRFDAARRRIGRRAAGGAPLDLAGIAAELGYADQSHLAREFRDFAGLSPTRWLAAELRGTSAADVPDVQAAPGGRRAA